MLDELLKGFIVIPADLPWKWVKADHLGRKGKSWLIGKDVQPLQSVKNWYTSRAHGQERPWGFLHRRWWFLCVIYVHYLLLNALHYLCHINHEIVGAIQSSCYTCGVRHGLTLAISSKPQEKFRHVINQSVGSCREKLIPEVRVVYPLFAIKGYPFYTKYVIFVHCLLILHLICSYMWDLAFKTHI